MKLYTRILTIRKRGGQWQYSVDDMNNENGEITELVSWQYGPHDRQEMLDQAVARFGKYDKLIDLEVK